jgi:hypothetical protein
VSPLVQRELPSPFCSLTLRLLFAVRHQTTVEKDLTKELIGECSPSHLPTHGETSLSARITGDDSCIVYCLRKTDTEAIAAHLVKLGVK